MTKDNLIRVIEASFITSATNLKECVAEGINEVVFLGRSNVGKSSLLNSLTGRKNLAKSSSTPGKTRLINFFSVIYKKDDEKYKVRFVDLPGFGYAKVSKSEQAKWHKELNDFITNRVSIKLFIHLIDSRHYENKKDLEVREYLRSIKRADQDVLEVFTKFDKIKQKELSKLKRSYPNALLVSNLKKSGIEKVNEEIFKRLFSARS